jgi:16S rRNA processing protein RimM
VRRDRRDFLVPYVPEIVREVDLERRRVVLDPPPGLLDDDAVIAEEGAPPPSLARPAGGRIGL